MGKVLFKAVTVNKAIQLYSDKLGGALHTRDLIGFYLREGKIRARCRQMWKSNDVNLDKAWKKRPAATNDIEKVKLREKIPTEVWRKSKNWSSDLHNWEVNKGRISLTVGVFPCERIMILGLRLHGGDLKDIFAPSRKSRPGITTDKMQWRYFWHEVIRLIQNGRESLGLLEDASLGSNDKLTDYLETRHPVNSFDDQSHKLASAVAKRLPFNLGHDSIFEEVQALRREFGLSR